MYQPNDQPRILNNAANDAWSANDTSVAMSASQFGYQQNMSAMNRVQKDLQDIKEEFRELGLISNTDNNTDNNDSPQFCIASQDKTEQTDQIGFNSNQEHDHHNHTMDMMDRSMLQRGSYNTGSAWPQTTINRQFVRGSSQGTHIIKHVRTGSQILSKA